MAEPRRNRRLRVYLAGPYDGSGHPVDNTRKAAKTAAELLRLGVDPFVPHTGLLVTLADSGPSRGRWLEWGLSWLRVSDAVLRLPGRSPGADAECEEASRLGIPVFGGVDELLAWDMAGRPPRRDLAVSGGQAPPPDNEGSVSCLSRYGEPGWPWRVPDVPSRIRRLAEKLGLRRRQ